MRKLNKSFSGVAGGVSFYYMVNELLRDNGVDKAKLYKNWKNDKTVFEINNKKYVISRGSYIFKYDGQIEFEEFFGKTRELSNTIKSDYRCSHSYDAYGNYPEGEDFFIVDFER